MQAHKTCPECEADWQHVTEEAGVLSDAGYLHKDVTHLCTECGATWLHGHPEGETANQGLLCDVCGDTMLVHKFDVEGLNSTLLGIMEAQSVHGRRPGDRVPLNGLHLKCPSCKYFKSGLDGFELDNGEVALGYPSITGAIDDA